MGDIRKKKKKFLDHSMKNLNCTIQDTHTFTVWALLSTADTEVMRDTKHKIVLEFVAIKPYGMNPNMKMQ